MNPLDTFRRAPWFSGALALILVVGIVAPTAYALGVRHWSFHVGLIAMAVLLMGAVERMWQHRQSRRPPKARRRFKVVPGRKGNGEAYDLAEDESTNKQRWLM